MPVTLEIDGKRVQMDDAFLDASPEEQEAAINEFKAAQEPEQPKPSLWGNVIPDNLAHGGTYGGSDEIEAMLKSGEGIVNPRFHWGDYGKELEATRARMQAGREKYPVASTIAEIGGAALVPGGLLKKGAGQALTMGQRMMRGMGAGAGGGLTYGWLTGEGAEDRAIGGGVGAVAGVGAGAAMPPIMSGVRYGVDKIGQGVKTGAGWLWERTLGGAARPGNEATRRVNKAVQIDQRAGGAGLTPDEFAAAQHRGQPVVAADMGGETTRAVARSAHNVSPDARALMDEVVDHRFEAQGPRIGGFMRKIVGGTDAETTREALKAAARKSNMPAYRKAYKEGAGGLRSEELERLSGAPAVAAAMARVATTSGKNRAIADGLGAFNPRVRITDDMRIEFPRTNKAGGVSYPDLQFWDYVKGELDDAVNAAYRSGRGREANSLKEIRNQLRDELDALVPSYEKARQSAARFFGAEDALEAGERFATRQMSVAKAQRAIEKMSDPERKLFREGYVSKWIDELERADDRRNLVRKIFGSPEIRKKHTLALGRNRAKQFEAYMRVEEVMDRLRPAIQGNSTTTRQLIEQGLAGGVPAASYWYFNDNPSTLGIGVAALAGGFVKRGIDRRVANKVAERLMSENPKIVEETIERISRNSKLMGALRKIELPAIGAAAQQTVEPGKTLLEAEPWN